MSSIRTGWIIGDYQFLTYSSELWREPDKAHGSFSSNLQSSKVDFYSFNLYSIALSPPGEGWAVGRTNGYDKASGHANNAIVILHYQDSTWFVSFIAA